MIPFCSSDVVADGRVRQMRVDLRELSPTIERITGMALGVHAEKGSGSATFELIELRFEAAPNTDE